jgi:hypothetical protein
MYEVNESLDNRNLLLLDVVRFGRDGLLIAGVLAARYWEKGFDNFQRLT